MNTLDKTVHENKFHVWAHRLALRFTSLMTLLFVSANGVRAQGPFPVTDNPIVLVDASHAALRVPSNRELHHNVKPFIRPSAYRSDDGVDMDNAVPVYDNAVYDDHPCV